MEPLDRMMREVAQATREGPSPEQRIRQRRALVRLSGRMGRRRLDAALRWAYAGAVVLLLFGVMWQSRPRSEQVPAAVVVGEGDRIIAADSPRSVLFPDRSEVTIDPGAEAEVLRADPQVVEVTLRRGRLALSVVPNKQRAWSVTAGPYRVVVTGTRFSVAWRPQTGELSVQVTEGSVHVRGGTLDGQGRRLVAGDRLDTRDEAATTSHEAHRRPPAPVERPAASVVPTAPATGRASKAPPEWRALIKAGDHAGAIAALERVGFAATLARATAEEIDQVARSARFARDARLAREALETLHKRFPANPRGQEAVFLLGLVAIELERDPNAAADAFTRYLRAQPHGALAEEARGRLLLLWQRSSDADRAQDAAREYLRHHPEKRLAPLARKLLDDP